MIKRLLSAVILTSLVTTQAGALDAQEPVALPKVALTKCERVKISKRILGDIRKEKALRHFDRFLTRVMILSTISAGAGWSINKYSDGYNIGRVPVPAALLVAGTAGLLKIPVTIKRMKKEGYYVGSNPFKLFWNGIKFKTVGHWA